IDPVCGMTVDPATAAGTYTHEGKPYYFCSRSCLQRFQADPEHYLQHGPAGHMPPPAPVAAPPGAKVEYICPMDPEIHSDVPGSCPKCGMALEPRIATLDEGPSPELQEMQRRFWRGLVLGLPVFVLAMGDMLSWHPLPMLAAS